MGFWVRRSLVRFGHVRVQVGDVPVGCIFSRTCSGEVEGGISGEPEFGARRSALFWKETSAGGETEVVGDEAAWIVGGIVWVCLVQQQRQLHPVKTESWLSPVAV